jgi:hypothetical protein
MTREKTFRHTCQSFLRPGCSPRRFRFTLFSIRKSGRDGFAYLPVRLVRLDGRADRSPAPAQAQDGATTQTSAASAGPWIDVTSDNIDRGSKLLRLPSGNLFMAGYCKSVHLTCAAWLTPSGSKASGFGVSGTAVRCSRLCGLADGRVHVRGRSSLCGWSRRHCCGQARCDYGAQLYVSCAVASRRERLDPAGATARLRVANHGDSQAARDAAATADRRGDQRIPESGIDRRIALRLDVPSGYVVWYRRLGDVGFAEGDAACMGRRFSGMARSW